MFLALVVDEAIASDSARYIGEDMDVGEPQALKKAVSRLNDRHRSVSSMYYVSRSSAYRGPTTSHSEFLWDQLFCYISAATELLLHLLNREPFRLFSRWRSIENELEPLVQFRLDPLAVVLILKRMICPVALLLFRVCVGDHTSVTMV